MARKRRIKRATQMHDVSLTPLIDTALTLLIIFMVATPMMHNSLRVTLPKGQAQENGNQQPEFVVEITHDKCLALNGKQCATEDELRKKLQELLGTQENKVVHIYGAQNVDYGYVIEFTDRLKTVGGIRHVALATQRRS